MNAKSNPSCLGPRQSLSGMFADVAFCLCTLLILPVVYHGFRPLALAGTAVTACAAAEVLCCLVGGRAIRLTDSSPAVTGLMIAMLMPLSAPLWLVAAACLFAVFVARAPFGATGHTPFNPAAAGVAFAAVCWPQVVFSYIDPSVGKNLPAFADCVYTAVKSPAAMLKAGLKPDILPLDMLWGNFTGPMGTTSILVIGACGLFLFFKKTASPTATIGFLLAAAAFAALFPRILCSPLTSVKYELLSGSLFFCAVFMVTEPVASPRTGPGRFLYGTFAGALTMLFRYFGAFEQGACFAVLLANAFAPLIDRAICNLRGLGGKLVET